VITDNRPAPLRLREIRQLLRKAWLETRGRFFAAAAIVSLLGLSTVLRAAPTIAGWEHFHAGEKMPYALYVWLSLSHGYLQFIWIICAMIIGLGGLIREQSLGTAGFTLGLPVSRGAIIATRAAVGAVLCAVLALLPEVLVALLSPLAGYHYPLEQAFLFAGLISGAGLIFYGLGFLLSHLFAGDYAAPSVGLGLAAAFYVVTKLPNMEPLNVYSVMTGAKYMIGKTYLLGSGFPVQAVSAWAAGGTLFILAAYLIVRKRDF
jgi:hypothetical protein